MLHKLLVLGMVVIGGFSSVHAQENQSLDVHYYYQKMFDTTLAETEFLENMNGFNGAIKGVSKPMENWHRGQTYYSEVFYKDSIQTLSSTSHFNSLRSPYHVHQLLYKNNVIRKVSCGGEAMRDIHTEMISGTIQSPIFLEKSSVNESVNKKLIHNDSVAVEESLISKPTCTETYYNHDLKLAVTFVVEYEQVGIQLSEFDPDGNQNSTGFGRKYTKLISLSYLLMDEKAMPYVYIENH